MPPFRPVFPSRPGQEEESENWFVTFGDLMALLLCFFILIAAISSFHLEKYKAVSETLARAMGAKGQAKTELEVLGEEIAALLVTPGLAGGIKVAVRDKGVVVDIRGGLLFPSASAELNQEARPVLAALGRKLIQAGFWARVEGHTDDQPINSEVYPSNWELSAARAAAVARFLISERMEPERLTIVGYGQTRPRAGNDSEEGRAQNRRVSLVITSGRE